MCVCVCVSACLYIYYFVVSDFPLKMILFILFSMCPIYFARVMMLKVKCIFRVPIPWMKLTVFRKILRENLGLLAYTLLFLVRAPS